MIKKSFAFKPGAFPSKLPGSRFAPKPKAPPPPPAPRATPADLAALRARAELAERTKDYLLSSVSSGVREPLLALAKDLPDPALAARARAMVTLVDDILDLAKSDSSAACRTDVAGLVTEIVESFRGETDAKGLTLSCETGAFPDLVVNPHRLRIVVRGLLDNAVKFTAEGRIGVTVTHFAEQLKITIEDTGCGIPPAEQKRMAEAGLGAKGKDLLPSGLAVIEHLALSMDADISLQSTPGLGTVIGLVLPGVKAAEGAPPRRMASMQRISVMKVQDQLPWKANFLLVDKSVVQRTALEGILKHIGFENISTVGSGAEALSRLMTGTVDIIFTDLDVPDLSGADLVAEIRRIDAFKAIPVYAITADESIAGSYARLGFDGYQLKPITAQKLHRILG